MAFQAGPIGITFTFQDDDLATAIERVYVPDGTALADAQAFGLEYAALIQPLTDCAMRKFIVSQEYYDDEYPTALPGSDVEDKGVLTFRTFENGSSKMTWPGIVESILVTAISRPGVYIDMANVDVAALVSALISGLGTPAIEPSTRKGEDLLEVKEAFKRNYKSQKSMGFKG